MAESKYVTYGYVREWEDMGSHFKHRQIEIEPPSLFEVGERVKITLEKVKE